MGGGGGKGGSAPDTPDYVGLAKQQGQNNMQIAQYLTNANRVNQTSPFGSSTWTMTNSPEYQSALDNYNYWNTFVNSGTSDGRRRTQADIDWAKSHQLAEAKAALDSIQNQGTWTQQTTLSPELQQLLNQNLGAMSNVYNQIGNQGAFNYSGYTPSALNLMSYNDYAKGTGANNAADSLYKALTAYMGESNATQNKQLESKLAAQGLGMGSGAYQQATNQLQDNQNQAYAQAANQAAAYAPQLQNQLYQSYVQAMLGQQNSNINLAGQNYQQAYNTWLSPYQALSALNGNQVQSPQFSQYNQATPYSAADILGATQAGYNADMSSYNAGQSKKGGLLGAGASLGGSLLGAFL